MISRPPYANELRQALAEALLWQGSTLESDAIPAARQSWATPSVEELLGSRQIVHREEHVSTPGGLSFTVSLFGSPTPSTARPGILFIHGGGLVLGNRFADVQSTFDWIEEHDVLVASVEYRLAPEHPYPAPIEDCFAGLLWLSEQAERLGVDPDLLFVAGYSAGGGLAAAVSLMARDRRGPAIRGQLLMAPMLDHRNESVSSRQYEGLGIWDRTSNDTGWEAYLGADHKLTDIAPYASPARGRDLSGLPPTYIDVGSAEVFRDECVDYARAIWRHGGEAELHIWSGGFHAFDLVAPHAEISKAARDSRASWLRRRLGRADALGA